MRIACVYLPAFPLQAIGRGGPHRIGQPVAVATAGDHPRVVAVSAAARARGIRSGKTASEALAVCPELDIVLIGEERYQQAAQIAAELIGATAAAVELPPLLAPQREATATAATSRGQAATVIHRDLYLYAAMPPRLRGATFGRRVLSTLALHGFRGRIGIADDRFTARLAARVGHGDAAEAVTVVARGSAAAFLAPLPLGLLPVEPDIERMLTGLGVETIGDFAALPPPKVSSPVDIDLLALARGAGPSGLRPTSFAVRVSESLELPVHGTAAADQLVAIAAREGAVRTIAHRLSDRLGHRGTGALNLEVSVCRAADKGIERAELSLPSPVASETRLFEALWPLCGNASTATSITVTVSKFGDPDAEEASLFDRVDAPSTASLDAAIERLEEGIANGFALTPTAPRQPARAKRANRPERTRRARPTGPNQPRLRGFGD